MEAHVQLKGICKKFNHIVALDGATLEAYKGEVLAVVGDNGAGKTTLLKVLSGVIRPDAGEIVIGESSYSYFTTDEALKLGICTVYQDLALGNTMDVASNIFVGEELTRSGFLQKREMHKQSRKLLDRLEIAIPDTNEEARNLSGGQRQGIAVARLVHRGGNILIFDEPTAAMGVAESEHTLKLIKSLAEKGMVVILICHNMAQVFEIADRIAIMRHGRVIVEKPASELTMQRVVALLTSAEDGDSR